MFAGESVNVTIRIDKSLIDAMFDKFGPNIKMNMISENEAEFTQDVQISLAFLGWCCSFGNRLKVVSPSFVVDKVKEEIESLINLYK